MNDDIRPIRLGGLYGQHERWGIYDIEGIVPTLTASMGMGGGHIPMIKENENGDKKESGRKQ